MSTQADFLFEKWSKWIDVLDAEILNLYSQRHVFQTVQAMLQNNPKLHVHPNTFNQWVAFWYSSSMSVAVRKQADRNRDSISYRRLLEGIKANPSVLSRDRLKRLYVSDIYTEGDANLWLDQVFGVGRAHIDFNVVNQEIGELEKKCASVSHFVNKRIAHHDQNDFIALPKFSDLHETIDHLGALHQKYFGIFKCLGTELLTQYTYDWTSIFRLPWIESAKRSI
jgi:hypothetical protein